MSEVLGEINLIEEKVNEVLNATISLLDDLLNGHGHILSRISTKDNDLEKFSKIYREKYEGGKTETVEKHITDTWLVVARIGTVLNEYIKRIKDRMVTMKSDDKYMDAAKLVEIMLKGYVSRIDTLRESMKPLDPRKLSVSHKQIEVSYPRGFGVKM